MAQYDTVFIGYPCWWGNAPMVVFTFLEEYDFSGKVVAPFSSYGTADGEAASNPSERPSVAVPIS